MEELSEINNDQARHFKLLIKYKGYKDTFVN